MYMQIRMPLACLVILTYTFLLFALKRQLKTSTFLVFKFMVFSGFIHVLSAVVTEYTVNHRDSVSFLFNHIWHIIFLVSITCVVALLYLYLILYIERGTGIRKTRSKLAIGVVASLSILGELFLPITYIDTVHGAYSLGPKAYALYLTVIYVLVTMVFLIIRYWHILNRKKTYVMLATVAAFVAVSTIQIAFPYILLTSLGVTLAALGIAVSAEDVHMYISSDTKLYNERGCREILREAVLADQPFQVAAIAFLGQDEAIQSAMISIQTSLPERKYNVVCGTLADNLLLVAPVRNYGKIAALPALPTPEYGVDVSCATEVMDFDGNHTVTQIVDALRDFKSRYEEDALQRDELTGLFRRAAVIRQMEYMIKAEQSFTFLMVDLDNFKQVNDQFGHDTGDRLLQMVARMMEAVLRSSDTVCRMGGDEFGLVLSGLTNPELVVKVIDRLCKLVADSLKDIDADIQVTLSMGAKISTPGDPDRSFREIYTQADAALYRSKYRGKNRLTFAGEES